MHEIVQEKGWLTDSCSIEEAWEGDDAKIGPYNVHPVYLITIPMVSISKQ